MSSPVASRATTVDYQPAPFSKYQQILDRMPFGALPPNFGQTPPEAPTQTEAQMQAEQQKLAQQINMSCINITPDGSTAIGFTDLSAKPPVNFYLLVGASAGGWTVIDADYDLEVAIIEKDGVRINLKLGKGLIDAQSLQELIAKKDGTPPPEAAVAPANPKENLLEKRRNREPAFKTATEQLISMMASAPPGSAPPPLPISEDDTLDEDAQKALSTTIVIDDKDDESSATHKENVAWVKEDMRQSLSKEGGTAGSYIQRLYERQKEIEEKRNEEAEKLRKLAEKAAKAQVKAELEAINARLEAEGIPAIQQQDVLEEE